jgi:UDP-N-acetylglucosamine transferase subunit ALG13
MGTIISALTIAKPIVIVPRQVKYHEHRNDHQMATAEQLAGRPGIYVAWSVEELEALLVGGDLAPPQADLVAPELGRLHETLRGFLRERVR